jgi:hypothetical protein
MAHKDITARRTEAPPRSRKAGQATPMAQQRPDLGALSAPQTLVRLVGCHDARTKKADAAGPQQAAPRSRPRH